MKPEEKSALVAAIFSDESEFEKHVLDIRNEEDRREVMEMLADEIVMNRLREEINFSALKSYDDLHTEGIIKVILQRISSEAAGYLEERLRYTRTATMQIIRQTANLLFLKRLSLYYFKRYAFLIFERVADTLFENVAAQPTADKPPKQLLGAIEGTPKRMPLFKGSAVTFEYVWKHARKALMERKKETAKIQMALASILKIMEGNENLEASQRAKLTARYEENRRQMETIQKKSLALYDGSIRRMKHSVVEMLMSRYS